MKLSKTPVIYHVELTEDEAQIVYKILANLTIDIEKSLGLDEGERDKSTELYDSFKRYFSDC